MIDIEDILTGGSSSVTSGEIVYPPGSTYGPVIQPTVEVGFVYEGTMAAWIDGVRNDVGAGMACLLLPGHHSHFVFSKTTETHHSWVHFWSPRGYPRAMIERLTRLPRAIRLSSTLAREMRDLLELSASRVPTKREIELLLAHRLLFQYVGEAELVGGLGVVYTEPVDRALQHIDDHLGSELDLEAIAEAAVVSTSHLIRLFHEQLGTTPSRYLWNRRVQRGVELLEETGLTIGEIANRCGFSTSHHFSRRVHESTGCTPTVLRRRARARGVASALAQQEPREP